MRMLTVRLAVTNGRIGEWVLLARRKGDEWWGACAVAPGQESHR